MPRVQTIIDKQYNSNKELMKFLKKKREVTFLTNAEEHFKKNLLLAVASFFEKEITNTVGELAKIHSKNNEKIITIVKMKVVERQYHTYFNWEGKNANQFFSMFGDRFKIKMVTKVKKNSKLEESIKSFIELGKERNNLVHQNFAEFVLEKTSYEIYKLYRNAELFIKTIKKELVR